MAAIGVYPIIKNEIQYSHSYLNEGHFFHNPPTGKMKRETLHIADENGSRNHDRGTANFIKSGD